jgi:hypothetical protein
VTKQQTIEERINAALNGSGTSSATLTELIGETEVAIEEATTTAEQEHAKALDLATPDPAESEASARAATLKRARLVPTLAKLHDELSAAITSELHAKWLSDYRRVEEEHDALGQEFADVYRGLSVQLADL